MSTPLSPDALRAEELRQHLVASASFGSLPPEARQSIADGLDTILDYVTADPTSLVGPTTLATPAQATAADREPPTLAASPADDDPIPNDASVRDVPAAFHDLQDKVDFPAFVSHLIKGIFQSIVDSSISQMKAYEELVKSVVMQVDEYANTRIPDADARNYLLMQFGGMLGTGSGGTLKKTDEASSPRWSSTMKKLGLDPDLDPQTNQQQLIDAARIKLARQKQKLTATMVLMGINRIVVTNGSINASVVFHVKGTASGTEANTATGQSKSIRSADTTEGSSSVSDPRTIVQSLTSGGNTDMISSMLGSNSSAGDVHVGLSTWNDTSRTKDQAQAQAQADMTGSVKVNFKSDTFPIEQFSRTAKQHAEAKSAKTIRK